MIPKRIHYCWFGRNPKSGLILDCIASWEKYLPDYEVVEWNEDNFDVNVIKYTQQAYEAKKWAFVSDYVRLYALYTHGGVYFDTDVEVLKPLDAFLDNEAFTGFESNDSPITAVIGAAPGNALIAQFLKYYEGRDFVKNDGSYDLTTNTSIITDILRNKGIQLNGKTQRIDSLTIYPQIYFCPNNLSRIWNRPSKNSYAIHHFDQSWRSNRVEVNCLKKRVRRYLVGVLRKVLGTENISNCKKKLTES